MTAAPAAAIGERPRLLLAVTHGMTANLLMRGQLADLAGAGFRVGVVASPGPDLDEIACREEVEVFPLAMRRQPAPVADLVALLRMAGVLRRFRPHLLSAGTPKAGLLASVAGRLAGVPRRLYTVRGLRLETASGAGRRLLAAGERTAAACAHRVLCVSDSLRRRYVELGLAPAAKTSVVGDGSSNGVDVERFHPAADGDPERAALRRELGLAVGTPVIGFVGRFTRDKGLGELATAFFDHVGRHFPDARLLLVGDFEEGDPVSEAVRDRLQRDPRVVLAGFVADTAPYYRLMDVLAFPSHREGFPNAPLEAAASALPVAAFAATGSVDAVDDGGTGRLVPVGDSAALAGALNDYLADPALARRHGAAGRRRAVERFSQRRVWDAWRTLYLHELSTAGLPLPHSAAAVPRRVASEDPR